MPNWVCLDGLAFDKKDPNFFWGIGSLILRFWPSSKKDQSSDLGISRVSIQNITELSSWKSAPVMALPCPSGTGRGFWWRRARAKSCWKGSIHLHALPWKCVMSCDGLCKLAEDVLDGTGFLMSAVLTKAFPKLGTAERGCYVCCQAHSYLAECEVARKWILGQFSGSNGVVKRERSKHLASAFERQIGQNGWVTCEIITAQPRLQRGWLDLPTYQQRIHQLAAKIQELYLWKTNVLGRDRICQGATGCK